MARSGVFILLVGIELTRIQIIRSQYGLGIFSNKRLLVAVAVSTALALFIVYMPGLNTLFKVKPLSMAMWIDIAVIVSIIVGVGILFSFLLKRLERRDA